MTQDRSNPSIPSNPSAGTLPVFEDIQTARLDLVAVKPETLHCQARDAADMRLELGALLHANVPDAWPHENWEPHVYEYLLNLFAQDAEAMGWCRYVMFRGALPGSESGSHGESRMLIGSVGCGFPKPETGEAEFGYGILPAFQCQGYATEAVAALLPWVRSRRRVPVFVAQTFPHLAASIRVLEKSGFVHAGAGFEEGTILFREMAKHGAEVPNDL